jgi:hypothetical protein
MAPPLRSLRALAVLNVAAVGASLGGLVGIFFETLAGGSPVGFAAGASTTVLGALWAWLLRGRRTVGRRRWPLGWALSVPLAATNAAVSLSIVLVMQSHSHASALSSVVMSFVLGTTLGAFVWVPWLLVTLVLFGVPIHAARKLARRGLAGEERGEWMVGGVCALVGGLVVVLALNHLWAAPAAGGSFAPLLGILGAFGGSAGALAAVLALARERRRRAFVARVEAGAEPNYRVDPTREGKVLIRVLPQGQGYRVADFEERVAELGNDDEVVRATDSA